METAMQNEKKYQILLLTNRDSDNVGDQVIEACDIALISTVMKNLNIDKQQYKISSRSASIVTQKYLATRDEALLKNAEEAIKKADIVIFGGAPVFNYQYQNFYDRTAVTLDIAKKYNVPVLFSAIGVEGYDEDDPKCQSLKKTLNYDCVKMITTRDDFLSLQKYRTNEKIEIGKVADPAVFTSTVLRNFKTAPDTTKKIGIFVLRANGFIDNKVDFSRDEAAKLWIDLSKELVSRGYDYEFLTSGHFGDEAFLDYLIRSCNVPANKCVFNINSPERLIQQISTYNGVISCRLHPSIIAFSLEIPAVGLVWNNKVTEFYNSIAYPERVIQMDGVSPQGILAKLEQAMEQGVSKNETFMCSVYDTLFYSIKRVLCDNTEDITPYNYTELLEEIPAFNGTSVNEQGLKLGRKFRRTYQAYNVRYERNRELQDTIASLEKDKKSLEAILKKNQAELDASKKQIESIKTSKSYKLAMLFAFVPRKIANLFQHKKQK